MSKKNEPVSFNPVFVKTKNVRNFSVLMDGLDLAAGEGRLGMVYGRAGRGKTRTAQWYAAHNNCVYIRVWTIWSELDFLKALARELGVVNPPGRRGTCAAEIVDRLVSAPRPIFLDEIEKLSRRHLDTIRDISDTCAVPIVLIGEEELVTVMRANRRVWSRTYQQVEFAPITAADILLYAGEATGLKLETPQARIMHEASGGDFRIVRRDLLTLIQYANARGTNTADADMVKMAVKSGLNGAN
ncbi:MAG: ATP-binding protein [Desulfobacterales bacterium]|nr:ATP-binding protein [Desulfobacterales bacterium]